jgi:hypothetical protein
VEQKRGKVLTTTPQHSIWSNIKCRAEQHKELRVGAKVDHMTLETPECRFLREKNQRQVICGYENGTEEGEKGKMNVNTERGAVEQEIR